MGSAKQKKVIRFVGNPIGLLVYLKAIELGLV
jgi:hypothetical protein